MTESGGPTSRWRASVLQIWNEARVRTYSVLRDRLPPSVRNWIAQSDSTALVRELLLRPRSLDQLVTSDVDFQGRKFSFVAPVKTTWGMRRHGGIENQLCRLVLQECPPGGVAIDVGANYGFVSLVMASAVGPSGHVYAFEVDRDILAGLDKNIEINGFSQRCHAVHAFVEDVGGHEDSVTIDAFVREHGVAQLDFLKVDVDGPDLRVLQGARGTLARYRPVVVVEISQDQDAIVSFLRELGYRCLDMRGQEIDPANWPPNVIAVAGREIKIPVKPKAVRKSE